ncbi:MAG: hypothetical protein GXY23_08720, partial [Myxococcales bacterium]|nr:hypothetical protein [Myxococcales bacterium]
MIFLALLTFLVACSDSGTRHSLDGGFDDGDVTDDGDGGGDGGGGNTDGGDGGPITECVPPTCADLADGGRQACGVIATVDSCGVNVTVDCRAGEGEPACPGVLFCAQDEDGISRCREPENTCERIEESVACAGIACGTASDGCDGIYECPNTCAQGDLCIQGSCVTPTCTPRTCENAGPGGTAVSCGVWGDGCGDTIDCNRPANEGGCADGLVCNGADGSCVEPACTPADPSLACAGTCGKVSDGCGDFIDCDEEGFACPDGTVCGGGETPGVCGAGSCDPRPAEEVCEGKCGYVGDGCGAAYNCSALPDAGGVVCTGNEWCGG